MAARFGEMLLNRRRQMGLSIQQVANTIKIRPQIIEYFETGNFAAMPPRGYAQGMISSYARFLGLNPREVVNAYFDEACEYERVTSSSGGRLQDAAGYVSPRSSTATGRFMMVDGGAGSRFAQRPPQAGYVTESGGASEFRESRDRLRRTLPPAQSSMPAPYSQHRDPRAGYGDGGYAMRSQSARDGRTQIQRRPPAGQDRGRYQQGRSGQAPRRSGSARYGQGAGAQGRRPVPQRGAATRGRTASSSASPLSDSRVIFGGLALILVLIVLVIVLLVRSCSASGTATDSGAGTPAATAATDGKDSGSDAGDDDASDDADDADVAAGASGDDDAGASTADGDEPEEDTETVVKVEVADGKTAWVEVKLDGKSVLAEQVTGPFSREFTPESSIEITTSQPSDVSVYKNDESVRYDTKVSGVARVTITVPKKATEDDADAADGDAGSTDQQQSQDQSTGTAQQ